MELSIEFKDELKKVEKGLSELERKAIPRAANRTNNNVAITARKEAVKDVGRSLGKATGLNASGIKKAIQIKKSTVKTLVATISAHGRPLPLVLYVKPSMRKPGVFNRRIVSKSFNVMQGTLNRESSYAFKGVEAKPWNKKRTFKHTFIAETKSGHVGVFVRKGKKRGPIKELYGPGIPSEFLDEKLQKQMKRTIEQSWRPRFDRELAFYLSKFNK